MNILDALQHVKYIYVECPKKFEQLQNELRDTNNEIEDLKHVIELGSLDAVSLMRTSKELKQVSVRRRSIKNELEILEEIMHLVRQGKPSNKSISLAAGKVKSITERQTHRYYTMKVRKDLQDLIR